MSSLAVTASILSPIGSVIHAVTSVATTPLKDAASIGLSAVSTWIVAGAEAMLHEVVNVISAVTTPSLSVSWFSGSYWRVSALAMLLTVPFLFAAAVQSVIRADMGVLIRAAFFDLPIAAISVTLAAPLITLMLAATDEMCTLVTGSGRQGANFLDLAATDMSKAGSGAMLAVIAVIILIAGLVLAVELIMRSAAIYIVVLFLPLGFAAMVWPARRVWIKRMIELLVALILSKFAMVAILSLAVAGLTSLSTGGSSLTTALTAMALMVLAAFSPWALLRLLPFTELAAGLVGGMHKEMTDGPKRGEQYGLRAADAAAGLTVDPAMAGVNALRNFTSNGSGDPDGRRGGAGRTSLTPNRTGDLPPGSSQTGGGGGGGAGPSGGGGAGPGGGGGGGAVIFPAFDEGPGGVDVTRSESGSAPEPALAMSPGESAPSPSGAGAGAGAGAGRAEATDDGAAAGESSVSPPALNPGTGAVRGLIGSPPTNDHDRAVRADITSIFGDEDEPALINLGDASQGFVIAPQPSHDVTPGDDQGERTDQ